MTGLRVVESTTGMRHLVEPLGPAWWTFCSDLAVSRPDAALDLIRSLPGTKHLIAGNHDGCHPMHRDAHKRQAAYLTAFASVQSMARRRINGVEVMLSHFPYTADHTANARHGQYRLRDEGGWLLHGHTHGAERLHGHEVARRLRRLGLDACKCRHNRAADRRYERRESDTTLTAHPRGPAFAGPRCVSRTGPGLQVDSSVRTPVSRGPRACSPTNTGRRCVTSRNASSCRVTSCERHRATGVTIRDAASDGRATHRADEKDTRKALRGRKACATISA